MEENFWWIYFLCYVLRLIYLSLFLLLSPQFDISCDVRNGVRSLSKEPLAPLCVCGEAIRVCGEVHGRRGEQREGGVAIITPATFESGKTTLAM
jgi:hypothetical protein